MTSPGRIGLDIGGTKIAGCLLGPDGTVLDTQTVPTPQDSYDALLNVIESLVRRFDEKAGAPCPVGAGVPGRHDAQSGLAHCVNIPDMRNGKPLSADLGTRLNRAVHIANDANCAALAEATDGSGVGFGTVAIVTLGTGLGVGYVHHGRVVAGRNGLAGEIGHVPLPWREEADGPVSTCACGATGCIEQALNGGALERLYRFITGLEADTPTIAERITAGDAGALATLDRYKTVLAKALTAVVYSFDPDVIVLGGGLSALPGLADDCQKRWNRYLYAEATTPIRRACHGSMAGMRGAALLVD